VRGGSDRVFMCGGIRKTIPSRARLGDFVECRHLLLLLRCSIHSLYKSANRQGNIPAPGEQVKLLQQGF
jgi:hypothetical protein